MVVKGNVADSDRRVPITCPKCGKQHLELLVAIENKKQAVCPECGFCFEVKV